VTRRSILAATAIGIVVAACGVDDAFPSPSVTALPGVDLSSDKSLLVVGDWGSGTDSEQDVAEAMARYADTREIAAIVTTGDNLYEDDARQIMEPFGWARERDIPFLISWGNHDVESQRRIDLIEETFAEAPRWWMHEWGPIDIVMLDSTQVASGRQMEFFQNAIVQSDDPTIVVFHHPPYSCGSHGDDEAVAARWVTRFDDDVVLVLSGHEHNYQRFESEGVTFVVTGGGGATLTDLAACSNDHPARVSGEAIHHFVALEFTDSLNVTAIDSGDNVIDEFSLTLAGR
jgi:predicted phosphodiesterase